MLQSISEFAPKILLVKTADGKFSAPKLSQGGPSLTEADTGRTRGFSKKARSLRSRSRETLRRRSGSASRFTGYAH